MADSKFKFTECPRDAMQGIHDFIPTELKVAYINLLLRVGFDTVDFGSFVSPKAIPQLQDTAEVLARLDLSDSNSKLLAIVANYRGAEDACRHKEISYLGYPFSISETFQRRNANTGLNEAFDTVKRIKDLCGSKNKELLIYLSMGFGNPYGDEWNVGIVQQWASKLIGEGINIIALSDTVGIATAQQITETYPALCSTFPKTEFGLHLHATPGNWSDKVVAAYNAGCTRFDSAIKGYGGCPMAADELTGNIATENLLSYLESQNEPTGLDMQRFGEAMKFAVKIFN